MAGKDRCVRQVTLYNTEVQPKLGQVATAVFERWDKGIRTTPTRRDYALTEARAVRLTKALYNQHGVSGRFRPFLGWGFGWVWERAQ